MNDKNLHQPPDWLVPNWPAPAQVKALCTTRSGGQSRLPYDLLNLGTHVGDELEAVLANRALLQHALGVRPVFLEQVHGTQVQTLAPDTSDGTLADACLATQPGVACTIMVADCLPILLCDASGTWVAAAHAGWRGLAGQGGVGVVETTLAAIHEGNRALGPVDSAQAAPEIIAWLGPCIGPTAFEVGDDVRQAFAENMPAAGDCFVPASPGKWWANLPALARQRLQAAGITAVYGNDGSTPWCTVSNPSRFFSHRRDRVSGRLAACIWLG
ncbi:peptidoglycan editing factor PgeF [Rhodoferax sp.]|uniref:peptidoglycan editing factor PgeF n=1 Tax=Rhodoferax sp. TaxID=50421 RepID=UPI002ACEED85|nr:peptidoglycan editing factor PgeF [Rhodoferax sp.]MDZ7918691.1 peptidoglycan editing factor PgeF [Rhodoferax sp.]